MSIKVGIIGAGGMAQYHIPGFISAGAQVVAIADMNSAAADKVAAAHHIQHVYTDATQMLADVPDLDAVSVITPNRFHKPLAIAALRAGKHVFCEKPPALNAGELNEMKAAARQAGKTLMFNFNNRARPEAQAIGELIRAGALGRINSAQARWVRRTGIPCFGGWFTNKALAGGGPMIDLLHMVDLALYFMDYPEPQYVLAQTFNDFITDSAFKGPWGMADEVDGVTDVETAAHGFIRFKTGQVLAFQTSWAEMVRREEISVALQGQKAGVFMQRLFGRDGLDDTAADLVETYTHENGKPVNRALAFAPDPKMGRERSAANFIHALEGREATLNSVDQALTLMKIIDATYESARTCKPVEIK